MECTPRDRLDRVLELLFFAAERIPATFGYGSFSISYVVSSGCLGTSGFGGSRASSRVRWSQKRLRLSRIYTQRCGCSSLYPFQPNPRRRGAPYPVVRLVQSVYVREVLASCIPPNLFKFALHLVLTNSSQPPDPRLFAITQPL